MGAARGLILALVGIAVLWAVGQGAYRPPRPVDAKASVSTFSAYRAAAILQTLVGSGVPHPIGGRDGARVRAAILKQLSNLGYTAQLQTGLVCADGLCAYPVNIVAELGPPSADGGDVLLSAHYDSVPAGPGASDDAVGVATALELARILIARPAPRHRIIFLFTDGEEAGLLGAKMFVRDHPLAKHVQAAVNVDSRGTSGLGLMFETGSANAWLMQMYGSVTSRPVTNSLYYDMYKLLPNDTDFSVFKAAGYQGFNFALIGDVGRYHTPLDNVANADAGSIQHLGDNAFAVLTALANARSLHAPAAEAVFFDLYGRALISWPAQWTEPVAVLLLLLLLAEGVTLLQAHAVTLREVKWGVLGALGTLVLGTGLCALLLTFEIFTSQVPPLSGDSWIAHPLPMHVTSAAVAVFAAASMSAWLAKRAGVWSSWLSAALIIAFLAVACAVIAPGASFVFLLGTAAAILGALPAVLKVVRRRNLPAGTIEFAAIVPTLVIFAASYPLLHFLYMGLGSRAWPVATLILSFVTVNWVPLFNLAASHRRAVIVTAAAVAAGGTLLTLCLPTYSADWPQKVNVEYWLDADSGQAHHWVQCDSQRLPASLAAAAHFDAALRPRFVGSDAEGSYAPAKALPLAAPELTVMRPGALPRTNIGAHLDLHLRSVRGAPGASVIFPSSAHVSEVEMSGPSGSVRVPLSSLPGGATQLQIIGLPESGITFSVDTTESRPLTVQVFDQSYGLEDRTVQRARPANATSSQDGDLTVVYRTVTLTPGGAFR